MEKIYDIVVVGGGPSGIMAAITAKEKNKDKKICILEHRESLGKKLSITGGGRCNITNSIDISDFFDQVVNNSKFLYSSLYTFTNKDLISFLKSLGIGVIEENNGKIYLSGSNGKSFVEILHKKMIDIGIDVFLNEKVVGTCLCDSTKSVFTEVNKYTADYIVFATGGVSYPTLSSDGGIFNILKSEGYNITALYPALVPIRIKEKWFSEIPGVSLEGISIKVIDNSGKKKRVVKTIVGEIVFTHRGIGGPAALKVSSYINKRLNSFQLEVDFITEIDSSYLILKIRSSNKKTLFSILKEFLPNNFVKTVLQHCNVLFKENYINKEDADVKNSEFDFTKSYVDDMSNKCVDILLGVLKSTILTPISLESIDRATVTSGGVAVNDINSSTMESKIHEGVYFVGEMIDVDALTGGFNLQIAFSTGYLAGISMY